MLSIQQTALQHLENGNWADAHDLIQHEKDTLSCLIHAHLHRLERDVSNAAYWYQRAGKNLAGLSLEQEFDQLVSWPNRKPDYCLTPSIDKVR